MKARGRVLVVAAAGLLALTAAVATTAADRTTIVISDLHMGLGYADEAAGIWDATEDFRWPRALGAFLDCISPRAGEPLERVCTAPRGGEPVDLVIAGDFLELWQPPADIPCKGPNKNLGCSVPELERLVARVVAAHTTELEALAVFAARNDNCVHVIPGNHDAALLVPTVWRPVAETLRSAGGCVTLAGGQGKAAPGTPRAGTWVSPDGYLVAEHGHEIGRDANGYKRWPRVTKKLEGVVYLQRPWGDRFVQEHFNREERHDYPLIDNLKPKSAGLRYRAADRGIVGTVSDFATFLKFNLLDTSWRQKLASLGPEETKAVRWDVDRGRALGHELVANSLPVGDPLRERLVSDGEEWADLRRELDRLVQDPDWLSKEEVEGLCDQLALQKAPRQCAQAVLGAGLQKFLFSRRRIVRKHLQKIAAGHPTMRAFAYGHTHAFEVEWSAELDTGALVHVVNSGAFQRLVDGRGLQAIAEERNLQPAEVLRKVPLEDLPACYTFVEVKKFDGVYDTTVQAWIMRESDATGRFADPCGPDCPNVGDGCDEAP